MEKPGTVQEHVYIIISKTGGEDGKVFNTQERGKSEELF